MLDGRQSLLGKRRFGVAHAACAGGLDDDDVERVADRVVQLAGEARTLVADGCVRVRLALRGDHAGALVGHAGAVAVEAKGDAQHPDHAEGDPQRDQVAQRGTHRLREVGGHEAGQGDDAGKRAQAVARQSRGAEEGHEHAVGAHVDGLEAENGLQRVGQSDDGEHRDGPETQECQGHGRGQHEDPVERVGGVVAGGVTGAAREEH